MKKFSGVGVALVTPFDETGRVDEHSLRNLVNYVVDGGVDYLVALGTTSEAATMTADERAFVVQVIAEENAGRLPIVSLSVRRLNKLVAVFVGRVKLMLVEWDRCEVMGSFWNALT